MGVPTISIYRPKRGKREPLIRLLRRHLRILRKAGLISRRHTYLMGSEGGLLVQVFEWASDTAKAQAHELPAWRALWPQFEALCDYETLSSLPEAQRLFPTFNDPG